MYRFRLERTIVHFAMNLLLICDGIRFGKGSTCGYVSCLGTQACVDQSIGANCPSGPGSFCFVDCFGIKACEGNTVLSAPSSTERVYLRCDGTQSCSGNFVIQNANGNWRYSLRGTQSGSGNFNPGSAQECAEGSVACVNDGNFQIVQIQNENCLFHGRALLSECDCLRTAAAINFDYPQSVSSGSAPPGCVDQTAGFRYNTLFSSASDCGSGNTCYCGQSIVCSQNPIIDNLQSASCENTALGGTCVFTCTGGFAPSGVATCNYNAADLTDTEGVWSSATCDSTGPTPTPTPGFGGDSCVDVGVPHSNASTPVTLDDGDSLVAKCDALYSDEDVYVYTCTDGIFSGTGACVHDGCVVEEGLASVENAFGGTCTQSGRIVPLDGTCTFSDCIGGFEWTGDPSAFEELKLTCGLNGELSKAQSWTCDKIPDGVDEGGTAVGVGMGGAGVAAVSFGLGLGFQILIALIVDSMQFFVSLSVLGGRTAAVHRHLAEKFRVVVLNDTKGLRPMFDGFYSGSEINAGYNDTMRLANETFVANNASRALKWWRCDENVPTSLTTADEELTRAYACYNPAPIWISIFFVTLFGSYFLYLAIESYVVRNRNGAAGDSTQRARNRPSADGLELGVTASANRPDVSRTGSHPSFSASARELLAQVSATAFGNDDTRRRGVRLLHSIATEAYRLSYLPVSIALGFTIGFQSNHGGNGFAGTMIALFLLYLFLPPVATLLLFFREKDEIMKREKDEQFTKFEAITGGRWWHKHLWMSTVVYRFGLLWPLCDFVRKIAIGLSVGALQWTSDVQIYNFLILFAIELAYLLLMIKVDPFSDRIFTLLKYGLHTINILACAIASGYVGGKDDSESVNDVGLTIVWLFVFAWSIALASIFYLTIVLPILKWYGFKCVMPKHVRDRSKLADEVSAAQEKMEEQILSRIGASDLVVDMRDVEIGVKLGAGGSGMVYKAEMSGTPCVAKSLISQAMMFEVDEFIREASMLAKLRHPNVVMFFGIGIRDGTLYLIQELCNDGSLRDFMKTKAFARNSNELAATFTGQLFRTIQYLHGRTVPIIHRDLKPDNILVSEGRVIKIGDLGTSREQAIGDLQMSEQAAGTAHYMPPEAVRALCIMREKRRASIVALDGRKWDVYSSAMCVLFLFNGGVDPFHEMNKFEAVKTIMKGVKPDVASCVPRGVVDIIRLMWHTDPRKRPTMREAGKRFDLWLQSDSSGGNGIASLVRTDIVSDTRTATKTDQDGESSEQGGSSSSSLLYGPPSSAKKKKKKKKPAPPRKKKKKLAPPPVPPPLGRSRKGEPDIDL